MYSKIYYHIMYSKIYYYVNFQQSMMPIYTHMVTQHGTVKYEPEVSKKKNQVWIDY